MKCVLDASVIVKWLLRDAESEPDTPAAQSLMDAVAGRGRNTIRWRR